MLERERSSDITEDRGVGVLASLFILLSHEASIS